MAIDSAEAFGKELEAVMTAFGRRCDVVAGVEPPHGQFDLAINKAVTAKYFDRPTSDLASLAQSGKPLFGIQESSAGKVVGTVGASAGTIEQDISVADAAVAALRHPTQSSNRSHTREET